MMEDEEKEKVLALYPEFKKIYGPYLAKNERRLVVLYDGARHSSRQLAKVRLEVKLGRRLINNETVDHCDEDCTNDDPSNLQVLGKSENAAKSHRASGRYVRIDHDQYCEICGAAFRDKKVKLTCGSVACKSESRRRLSIALGSKPP